MATVTVYNVSALSTTMEWAATTTPAQAYAHPIDGIALDYTPTTSAAGYTGGSASATGTADSDDDDSAAARLGGGQMQAGVVAAVLAAGAVGFFL